MQQGIRCPQMLIGICGRAGAGKDTTAEILRENHGFATLAFADALREEIVHAFAVNPGIFSRDQKGRAQDALAVQRCGDPDFILSMAQQKIDLEAPRSPRQIMQWWGTEFRRAQDPLYWVSRTALAIDAMVRAGRSRIALTDVRFPNEAQLVRRLLGVIWRIQRSTADHASIQHESESKLDLLLPDSIIQNDQSLVRLAVSTSKAFSASFPHA